MQHNFTDPHSPLIYASLYIIHLRCSGYLHSAVEVGSFERIWGKTPTTSYSHTRSGLSGGDIETRSSPAYPSPTCNNSITNRQHCYNATTLSATYQQNIIQILSKHHICHHTSPTLPHQPNYTSHAKTGFTCHGYVVGTTPLLPLTCTE